MRNIVNMLLDNGSVDFRKVFLDYFLFFVGFGLYCYYLSWMRDGQSELDDQGPIFSLESKRMDPPMWGWGAGSTHNATMVQATTKLKYRETTINISLSHERPKTVYSAYFSCQLDGFEKKIFFWVFVSST